MVTVRRFAVFLALLVLSATEFQHISYAQTATILNRSSMLRSAVDDFRYGAAFCGMHASDQPEPTCTVQDISLPAELHTLGPRGDLIAHARAETLQILQSGNSCSAWFEEADPETADVFRSLHYEIDASGPANIVSLTDTAGNVLFQHPWGARAPEGSGRNSFVELNGNGPFFVRRSRVTSHDPKPLINLPNAPQPVLIGPYEGATPQAQITILLHELGHVVARLPSDDHARSELSSENTREVLRHCGKEIHQIAARDSHWKH